MLANVPYSLVCRDSHSHRHTCHEKAVYRIEFVVLEWSKNSGVNNNECENEGIASTFSQIHELLASVVFVQTSILFPSKCDLEQAGRPQVVDGGQPVDASPGANSSCVYIQQLRPLIVDNLRNYEPDPVSWVPNSISKHHNFDSPFSVTECLVLDHQCNQDYGTYCHNCDSY